MLSDLLHSVPALLEMICPAHSAVLLATSSHLRSLVHHSAQQVHIKDADQLPLLVRGGWVQLQHLRLWAPTEKTFTQLAAGNWSSLQRLTLGHSEQLVVDNLVKADLPWLETLRLMTSDMCAATISQVASGQWPELQTLMLECYSKKFVTPGSILDLAPAQWPKLEKLNLRYWNRDGAPLSRQAPHPAWRDKLFPGNSWSALQMLCLSGLKVDCGTIKWMTSAHWPSLEDLTVDLDEGRLDEECIWLLTQAHWPKLKTLFLPNSLTIASVKQLSNGRWPQLESLDLGGCLYLYGLAWPRIFPDVFPCTKQLWPCLKSLDLSATDICAEGLVELVKGALPLLASLSLSHNRFVDAAAIEQLVSGEWPLLEVLNLADCDVGLVGLQHLVTGNWTLLTDLNLADCRICPAAAPQHTVQLLLNQVVDFFAPPPAASSPRPQTEAVSVLLQSMWPQLMRLSLYQNHFKHADIADLLHKWPDLQVTI